MSTEVDASGEPEATLNCESLEADIDSDSSSLLQCLKCDISFTSEYSLYDHLLHHIKQPRVTLHRVQLPPLRLTLKSSGTDSFEIVGTPSPSASITAAAIEVPAAPTEELAPVGQIDETAPVEFANVDEPKVDDGSECGSIPGAEPTPPPEPTPDLPKIRIKTTGLLKDSLTITEIDSENNPVSNDNEEAVSWEVGTPAEDPLKLPGTDDILSLFNNNERAKDFGFTTSDSEFIPLDRLDQRNGNSMQLYNKQPSQMNPNATLSNLTGLPMEALAQQVSRLQPPSSGMHQQNVLINIQQFPQAPPPHHPPYHPGPSPMYHPHPPPPPQPMYHHQPFPPYQHPPAPIYYPPAAPPYMQPPPMGAQQPPPPPPTVSSQAQSLQQPYRPPRQPVLQRHPPPIPNPQRIPGAMPRQRAPVVRPRGGGMGAVRGARPRMPGVGMNGVRQTMSNAQSGMQVKRLGEGQMLANKKKRLDVLTPDKDDEDCQVICMQPKNTDGGLPQIASVQGGTSEPTESSIMHLSDSITLSVRNPPPRTQSPKKSDAKAVANILATRGITVTATPKPKEKQENGGKTTVTPVQLNLNAAVSIIPSGKNAKPSTPESQLPTVDLTDDSSSQITSPSKPMAQTPSKASPPQSAGARPGLPFRCDLCPAQYPHAIGLSKHRQNYHKTGGGTSEIGIPLINLKQPGIFQKLSTLGIYNYIPLPSASPEGTFALPIINARAPGNVAGMGATTMLTLGPVRSIPKPQQPINGARVHKSNSN